MNTFFFEDCTISEYFRQQIEYLKGIGKVGTASKYETCKNLLEQCGLGKKRFEQVDLQFMQDFEAYMTRKGNNSNSLATSFSVLRTVYNKAVKQNLLTAKFSRGQVHSNNIYPKHPCPYFKGKQKPLQVTK